MLNEDKFFHIAPGENKIPMSLLFDTHAEELSFPAIYLGQFRVFRDDITVTPFMMATSELRRSDRRGVTPNKLLYAAMKILRLRVCDGLKIGFKHIGTDTNISKEQVLSKEYINTCLERNLAFMKSIPNSAAYWSARKRDLFAMMRQLGKPTMFLTISANEIGWPHLLKLLHELKNNGEILTDEQIEAINYFQKTTLVNEDAEIMKDGRIMGMSCSCKAGLGGACKHVVATLFYLNRNELENLKVISCTDKKCAWNAPKKSAFQQYDMNPLMTHHCLANKIELSQERKLKRNKVKSCTLNNLDVASQVTEDVHFVDPGEADNTNGYDDLEPTLENTADAIQQTDHDNEEEFRQIMINDNPSSALALHIIGRHDPVKALDNKITISAEKLMAIIINQETSQLLSKLSELKIKFSIKECCQKVFTRLSSDVRTICEESYKFHSVWLKERQLRITASNAYKIYTYRNNKQPDWKKKSLDYFFEASFSNAATKYGLEHEPLAREIYEEQISDEVIQCGLIVSKSNPWLGCSPDGVVFKNNKPYKILEIKCPTEEKKSVDVIKQIKWLEVKDDQVTLKKSTLIMLKFK